MLGAPHEGMLTAPPGRTICPSCGDDARYGLDVAANGTLEPTTYYVVQYYCGCSMCICGIYSIGQTLQQRLTQENISWNSPAYCLLHCITFDTHT